ncbi:hypothetical protein [Streptomyces aculeolatus]|uniref:hypothetical protein n=1 Tax=Streptomyces aculeolatus TaxID=270689 RepID=UPI001CED5745|nr:hypothetical protein [Streptomyces aculeolatus]
MPWVNDQGRPCYVREGGWLAEYADLLEGQQLDTGEDVLRLSEDLLKDEPSQAELRFVTQRLSEALRDALRVAKSRGTRLDTIGGHDVAKRPLTDWYRAWCRKASRALKPRRP